MTSVLIGPQVLFKAICDWWISFYVGNNLNNTQLAIAEDWF